MVVTTQRPGGARAGAGRPGGTWGPRRSLVFAGALALLAGAPARAQSAPPLGDGDFVLDLYRGPVQGSARVTALGGAFTGVAEDPVAIQFNPAAVAQRTAHSLDWFDWSVDWDFLTPGLLQGDSFDFNGSGYPSADDFLAYAAGGGLQFGQLGVGLLVVGQLANLRSVSTSALQNRSQVGTFAAGYGLFDHQLIVGGGARIGYVQLHQPGVIGLVWSSWSLGFDAGAIYRPRGLPLRVGLALNSQTVNLGTFSCAAETCGTFAGPREVVAPWNVRLGVAWFHSFDGRDFNSGRVFPKTAPHPQLVRERRDAGDLAGAYQGGRYLMVSADLAVTAPVPDAVGVDGLVRQERLDAGGAFTASVHMGAEAEVLARRLRLRLGSYWEPSRYRDQPGRLHGTIGLVLRLFDVRLPLLGWKGLSVQVAFDGSYRYTNLGVSLLSFWH